MPSPPPSLPKALFHEVFEGLTQPVGVCGPQGEVLVLNAAAKRLLGVSKPAGLVLGLEERDTLSSVRLDPAREVGTMEFFLADVPIQGVPGRRSISISLQPMTQGRFRVSFLEEESRQDSPSSRVLLFTPLFDQLEAAIVLCDARRLIRSCNGAFLRLIRQEEGRPEGIDVVTCFDHAHHAALRTAAAAAMSGALAGPLEVAWPLEGSTQPLLLEVRLAPLGAHLRGASRGFIVVAQPSQSNLARLEQRFVQADRLMELGHLATGVAHELKNPLTSILNYADYLLQKYRDHLFEQRDKERLVRIIEGVEQIDHFVRDLLAIARPETSAEAVAPVQVHEVIRRAGGLCEATFEACGVRLELTFAATHAVVEGIQSQLVQVFVNLLKNAATALPKEGGTITVATHQAGAHLVVTLKDEGCGMTKEEMDQMFEPFYTTRRATGGTGLGLVLVRSIVTRHHGQIHVQSQPGQGTSLMLRFPLHAPGPPLP